MYSAASTAGFYVSRKFATKRIVKSKTKPSFLVDPVTFMSGKRLTLNVSGCRFKINECYLKRFPNTLLGSEEREYFFDRRRNEYFFDRDPHIFRHIFGYYKTGKLHFSEQDCHESFVDELKFFRINIDEVSPCCSEPLMEKCAVKLSKRNEQQRKSSQNSPNASITFRQKSWDFLEDPQSSLLAKIVYYISCSIIIVSVTVNTVETVPCDGPTKCGDAHPKLFFIIDSTCVIFFSIEYLLRLWAAPKRWKHFKEVMSMIDFAAILPYYIDLVMSKITTGKDSLSVMNVLVTLRVLRIFRIFKLARHSKRLRELSESIRKSASELGFILFTYLIVVILFASVLYYAERQHAGTDFSDIPQSMWYTVVTTTTLGYGDIVPQTIQGKLVGSLCCLMGVLVIALPVPIIQMKNSSFEEIRQMVERNQRDID